MAGALTNIVVDMCMPSVALRLETVTSGQQAGHVCSEAAQTIAGFVIGLSVDRSRPTTPRTPADITRHGTDIDGHPALIG